MLIGHGYRNQNPWWCWMAMLATAVAILSGAAFVAAEEEQTAKAVLDRTIVIGALETTWLASEHELDNSEDTTGKPARHTSVVAEALVREVRLAELVEQFNSLVDEQRFEEARLVAKQAAVVDPEHPVVQVLHWKSIFLLRLAD